MDTWHVLRRQLVTHLAAWYDDPAKARATVETAGLSWAHINGLNKPNLILLWDAILTEAEASLGNVADKLVETASQEAGGTLGEKMRAIWEKRPRLKPIANVAALDAHQLWRRRCFINRESLRQELGKLKNQSRTILIINGPSGDAPQPLKLGKTYTRELVQHLARVEAKFKVAYYEHKRKDGASLTPDKLAEAIVADEIGGPRGAPRWEKESDESWAKRVCTWMVQNVFAAGGKWWVILDGLRDSDLPDETHELVSKLAIRVGRLTGNINIEGLILIDYPEDRLPPDSAEFTTTETVEPITPNHVDKFFRDLLTQRGEEFDDAAVAVLVDRVWAPTIHLNPEDRFRTLAKLVDDVLGKMFPE